VRVLLCVHHRLDPHQGAPGATLALGAALEERGCAVEYLGYDHLFGDVERERVSHQLRFPWGVARVLSRRSGGFDVVDASTGDAWLWASLGRPGGRGTALVTRAHGLEHIADEQVRQGATERRERLSLKYPLYHGGLRLWEVRRSLRASDQCVLLNDGDRDFVRERLDVPAERLHVIPNGIADHFHRAPPAEVVEGPLRLAFIGRWTVDKGKDLVVSAAARLDEEGFDFRLLLLGTMAEPAEVLHDFPEAVRPRVEVVARFPNERLPGLLAGAELFVFPSRSEGSSGALLEAMACGLAPVATPVGSATAVIADGAGEVVRQEELVAAVARLASDRGALLGMRRRAQAVARGYMWAEVAGKTLHVYEQAIAARILSRSAGP
jgi:glycosyltransferase involved in cell wall biosynthesis